mmetsp:Transcript_13160/g.19697  ORF Transcript_13160/g.19697 Transcript_13160/m.19697 type:complete len:673 (+) Transcript_13160:264-2282(+)
MMWFMIQVAIVSPYPYFDMAKDYWKHDQVTLQCLATQERKGWSFPSKTHFLTVGLEGCGHHLITQLSPRIAGEESGKMNSFSTCGSCNLKKYPLAKGYNWRLNASAKAANPILDMTVPKFLVLVRDPIDTFSSALNRFFIENDVDSLDKELDNLLKSMSIMSQQINRIPCDRKLYMSYEWLTRHPDLARLPMAAFLGVETNDPDLEAWFVGILRSTKSKVPWPKPLSIRCEGKDKYSRLKNFLISVPWPRGWISGDMRLFRERIKQVIYSDTRDFAVARPSRPMTKCAAKVEPRKSFIAIHIIEQFAGATTSLVQFANIAARTGRRAVLPGISTTKLADHTIYRAFNLSNIAPISDYISIEKIKNCTGVTVDTFQHHLVKRGNILDVVLIFINRAKAKRWFRPNKLGFMICPHIWEGCASGEEQCGDNFFWRFDFFGLRQTWRLSPSTMILCIDIKLRIKSFSKLLKRLPNNVAVLNWVGIDCTNRARICSTDLNPKITQTLQRECVAFSPAMHAQANTFQAKSLGPVYNSLHIRSEKALYLKCSVSQIRSFFQNLNSQAMTWNGTWFRAFDTRPGGTATFDKYKNNDLNATQELGKSLDSLWAQTATVHFVDRYCNDIDPVACAIVDLLLLAGAQRFVSVLPSGMNVFVNNERNERGKIDNQDFFLSCSSS